MTSSSRSATPRPWIAETGYGSPSPSPHRRGRLGLVAGVVDLVGDEEDRLAALAEQAHDVLVGRGGADHRVDDEQHDVAEVDRDLGLCGHRRVDAAGVGLPAAGVDEREAARHPLGLVGHAVAGDTGGVFDDGLAAAEDAVHQRRLADVRAADDRDDGQRGQELDAVFAELDAGQQRGILLVELVVGEARAQRGRPLFGELLVEVRQLVGELVGPALVLFFFSAHGGLLLRARRACGQRRRSPRIRSDRSQGRSSRRPARRERR